jgi:Dolichyl-phosphate-mannose-protein mannosyltransferase
MKRTVVLILGLSFIVAAATARWCMSSGIGVSPDSLVYLGAADSILAGKGIRTVASHSTPGLAGGKPLTVFPPTYPVLLSLSGILSTDRLNGARWLHSLLFAINVFLVGFSVCLATRGSFLAILCSILLFLSSASMLHIHTMAWSDPPFIMFALSALALLALYVTKPNYWFLVGAGLSAGLAITTRYVGITIFPPTVLTVLLLKDEELKRRIKDCLVLLALGTFPLAVWLVRNTIVADTAISRSFGFHPIGVSEIKTLLNTLLLFWVPFAGIFFFKAALLFLGGALVLSSVLLTLKDYVWRVKKPDLNSAVQMFAVIFAAIYPLFMLAYNSFLAPAADLDARDFAPFYVFVNILAVSTFYQSSKLRRSARLWWGFLALTLALIYLNAGQAVTFAVQRHENGSGYASREWAASKSLQQVTTLPEHRTIYSNGIDAIQFVTRREALRVPAKVDPVNGKVNADFERDINVMRNELMQNQAVLVYLDKINWRWYLPSKDELENVYKLPVMLRLDDGVFYGIK